MHTGLLASDLTISKYFSLLQFIREYSGKVDELIKDKIEAMKEEKAKQNEEKDVIKQQVCANMSFVGKESFVIIPLIYFSYVFVISILHRELQWIGR